MNAKVLKRTTSQGNSKVIRYVVAVDQSASAEQERRADSGLKGNAELRPKTGGNVKKRAKPATASFTVLKIVKPANPYLSTPKEALEIAKRAGIFTESGKLKPNFR